MKKDNVILFIERCQRLNIAINKLKRILQKDEIILEKLLEIKLDDLFIFAIDVSLAGYSIDNLLELLNYFKDHSLNYLEEDQKQEIFLNNKDYIKNGNVLEILHLLTMPGAYDIISNPTAKKYKVNLDYARYYFDLTYRLKLDVRDIVIAVLTNEKLIKNNTAKEIAKIIVKLDNKRLANYIYTVSINDNIIKRGLSLRAATVLSKIKNTDSIRIISEFLMNEIVLKKGIAIEVATYMADCFSKDANLIMSNIVIFSKIKDVNDILFIASKFSKITSAASGYAVEDYLKNKTTINDYDKMIISVLCSIEKVEIVKKTKILLKIEEELKKVYVMLTEDELKILIKYLERIAKFEGKYQDIILKFCVDCIKSNERAYLNYYLSKICYAQDSYQLYVIEKIIRYPFDSIATKKAICNKVASMKFTYQMIAAGNILDKLGMYTENEFMRILNVIDNSPYEAQIDAIINIISNQELKQNVSFEGILKIINLIKNEDFQNVEMIENISNLYSSNSNIFNAIDYLVTSVNQDKEVIEATYEYLKQFDLFRAKLVCNLNKDKLPYVIQILEMKDIYSEETIEKIIGYLSIQSVYFTSLLTNLVLKRYANGTILQYAQVLSQMKNEKILKYAYDILNRPFVNSYCHLTLIDILNSDKEHLEEKSQALEYGGVYKLDNYILMKGLNNTTMDIKLDILNIIKSINLEEPEYVPLLQCLAKIYQKLLSECRDNLPAEDPNKPSKVSDMLYYDDLISYCDNEPEDIKVNNLLRRYKSKK